MELRIWVMGGSLTNAQAFGYNTAAEKSAPHLKNAAIRATKEA